MRSAGLGRWLGALLAGAAALLAANLAAADDGAHPPGFALATAHPLATAAGAEILRAGGNAFDAAVAVSAALAVVEPYASGLGGGGFWLLHRAADGRELMLDGRECAPLAAGPDLYLDSKGGVVPRRSIDGVLAAGIPGEPAALVQLSERFGRLPLARSLAPAIRLAREGFPVDDRYRAMARFRLDVLRRSPAAQAVFVPGGKVPKKGARIRNPDLARTLERLARAGRAGFYAGTVARRLVQGVRKAGGIWAMADLTRYRAVARTPISGHYHDLRVVSAAPPSSGGIVLLGMLNILSGYPLDDLDPVTRDHLIIEAMRRAYRDRAEYLGDPDFVTIPVARLIHPWYAAGLRAGIRLDRATPSAMLRAVPSDGEGHHTTHFSIIDAEGNRVAATLSINYPFGSGFMAPGTGVLLNDEMDDFAAKAGVPNVYGLVGARANAIEPGKRPLSSMSPTFVENDDRVAVLGTPGGSRIISMVLLAVLDFDRGASPADWVRRARFHHQYLPDEVQFEPGAFSARTLRALRRMGHRLRPLDSRYGNMQAVLWDRRRGQLEAASDPRGIGQALVVQAPVTPPR